MAAPTEIRTVVDPDTSTHTIAVGDYPAYPTDVEQPYRDVVLQRQPGESFGFSLRNIVGGIRGMQVAWIAPNSPAAAAQRQGLLNVGDNVVLADGLPPAQFLAQPELFTKQTVVTLRIDTRYRDNSADYAKSVTLLNWTGLLGFCVFVGCIIALAVKFWTTFDGSAVPECEDQTYGVCGAGLFVMDGIGDSTYCSSNKYGVGTVTLNCNGVMAARGLAVTSTIAAGLASFLFFVVRSPKYEKNSSAVIALWLLGGVLGLAAVIVWGVQAHDNIESFWLSAVSSGLRFRLGFSFGLFVTTTAFQLICAGLMAASRSMK